MMWGNAYDITMIRKKQDGLQSLSSEMHNNGYRRQNVH